MKVLFASSEAAPFAKVGGLADVVGSLPISLKQKGIDAEVILPLHKSVRKYNTQFIGSVNVRMGWRNQYAGLHRAVKDNVTFYFVDNEYYFGGDSIYGYSEGEAEKYAFFALAVLELFPLMRSNPDIIHCNDWQTGLIPLLLKTRYAHLNIGTVFTIHNLKYQGVCGFNLVKDLVGVEDSMFTSEQLEFYGGVSYLKCGILYSDYVTTVSPTYKNESLTPEFGERMEGVLSVRGERYIGILNGLGDEFSPERDGALKASYSAENIEGKTACKTALQSEFGLRPIKDVPVIAIVSRLFDQKGLDLIQYMAYELLFKNSFQLIVLGTGEKRYEEFFTELQANFRERVGVKLCYDEALARRLYAGADMLLMPSRFEPCGLAQLIAMRYGTLPIVRATGGLNDTVTDFACGGYGFRFTSYNAHEMGGAVQRAITAFNDKAAWREAQAKAMSADFTWARSADKYIELYDIITEGKNGN